MSLIFLHITIVVKLVISNGYENVVMCYIIVNSFCYFFLASQDFNWLQKLIIKGIYLVSSLPFIGNKNKYNISPKIDT